MVQKVMTEGGYEAIPRRLLRDAVEKSGAIERARARGDQFAAVARTALDSLADSEFCESLKAIPTYVLDRDR
jgi:geranylgeranyl pyrophosphate synthase